VIASTVPRSSKVSPGATRSATGSPLRCSGGRRSHYSSARRRCCPYSFPRSSRHGRASLSWSASSA